MKVKVLKKFRDKHTGEYYDKGKILLISEERFKEITTKDPALVEKYTPKKAKPAEK